MPYIVSPNPIQVNSVAGSVSQTLIDLKPNGTAGGDGTSYVGVYLARDLSGGIPALSGSNSTTITGMSLSSNQFVLPSGTYIVNGSTPCCAVGRHRNRLYNVTDNNVTLLGQGTYENSGVYEEGSANINGSFTISAAKTFEFQERIETLPQGGISNIYALGLPMNFGDDEIYSVITITKIV